MIDFILDLIRNVTGSMEKQCRNTLRNASDEQVTQAWLNSDNEKVNEMVEDEMKRRNML